MKLLVELLAGAVACGAAYYVARPDHASPVAETPPRAATAIESRSDSVAVLPAPRTSDTPRIRAVRTMDAGPTVEEHLAMVTLRNEVIVAASADMHRRGADVARCLADLELAGIEKLRFSVNVTSSAHEATTGQWRFVEIVDGEPLPSSFGACAAGALGGGQHLVPPQGYEFPAYDGDLEILYTIPAPVAD